MSISLLSTTPGIFCVAMPQKRRRQAPDLQVPERDDAGERKRILNVLAQRRYRQRKREHVESLESQLNGNAPNALANESCDLSPSVKVISKTSENSADRPSATKTSNASKEHSQSFMSHGKAFVDPRPAPFRMCVGSIEAWDSTAPVDNPLLTPESSRPLETPLDTMSDSDIATQESSVQPIMPIIPDLLGSPASGAHQPSMFTLTMIENPPPATPATTLDFADFDLAPECTFDFDGQLAGISWSPLIDTGIENSTSQSSQNDQSTDNPAPIGPPLETLPDCLGASGKLSGINWSTSLGYPTKTASQFPRARCLASCTSIPPTHSSSDTTSSTSPKPVPDYLNYDFNDSLQAHRSYSFTFPDESNLKCLELDLLRGFLAIAQRLNIVETIWELRTTSPFLNSVETYDDLPVTLRPTSVQRTVPHHPMLDILPWPTARNKMIHVFSQTPDLRPPQAACPTALMDFVYDIEDSAEGVRIWGDDPCEWRNWELGEKVFGKWWWAFDGEIVKNSNEWRMSRGAPVLGMGSILGEVC